MEKRKAGYQSIDEYIAAFPKDIQKVLGELRATIRASAPGAEEKISYGMPAFALKGNLVYFAAFKNHIGFFPTSSGIRAFKRELAAYELSKGTVRFPYGRPLQLKLIGKIVKFRVAENLERAEKRPITKPGRK